jgi:hypothetical protein
MRGFLAASDGVVPDTSLTHTSSIFGKVARGIGGLFCSRYSASIATPEF